MDDENEKNEHVTPLILVVEDNDELRHFLKKSLKKNYRVSDAENGKIGWEKIEHLMPDIIITDLLMPEMDGLELTEKIKNDKRTSHIPVILLTAVTDMESKVESMKIGADDYITKPIKPRVLVSRIKALLRRTLAVNETTANDVIEVGGIRVEKDKHMVVKNEIEISLPKKEFKLLALLISKPGKVFSREYILQHVWGTEVVVGDRTIDVHIRKLREKIGNDYIKTIKGVGYKFDF
jgi:two-component system alkaline phosphatase synthesis response regulator PhoP